MYTDILHVYMVSCPVLTDPPPPWYGGGGVGTRIRYTHCISTLCRLSTLPQYYKPPPHHRGGWGILYTTTIPQTTPTPQGGGNPVLPPPMGGEGGGTGQHCTIYIICIYNIYIYMYIERERHINISCILHVYIHILCLQIVHGMYIYVLSTLCFSYVFIGFSISGFKR